MTLWVIEPAAKSWVVDKDLGSELLSVKWQRLFEGMRAMEEGDLPFGNQC